MIWPLFGSKMAFSKMALLLLLFGGLLSQTLAPNALAKAAPEVMVYLHSGTDRTGTMSAFDGKTITLKTQSGTEAIPRKSYQGLVLNTPSEKAISEKLSKDIGAYMEAGKFTYDHRSRIKQALEKSAPTCKNLKNFPWVHFTVAPNQTITNVTMLSSSGCPALDQHLVKTIQSIKPVSNKQPTKQPSTEMQQTSNDRKNALFVFCLFLC